MITNYRFQKDKKKPNFSLLITTNNNIANEIPKVSIHRPYPYVMEVKKLVLKDPQMKQIKEVMKRKNDSE